MLFVRYPERGKDFTLDVPHYNDWKSLLNYFKKRGFKVSEIPHYIENYNCLSKYHRQAVKGNIIILLEIDATGFKIEVGDIRNMFDSKDHFKGDYNHGYFKPDYLGSLKIKNEIFRLKNSFISRGFEYLPCDDELTEEQHIIEKEKINPHIHGKNINSLSDISAIVNEYPDGHNNMDANKKRIVSGELKYFYDWKTKRLSCGIAIHNINNMWWVMINGTRRNLASFELFDFNHDLPKRDQRKRVQKIQEKLSKMESEKKYLECQKIHDYMTRNNLLNKTEQ